MGAQLSTVAPTATVPIGAYVAELGDITYSSDLGRGRFLKTVRASHEQGQLVVKVFIKPPGMPDLLPFRDQLAQNKEALQQVPNALGFDRIVETDRAGYLVRQFVKFSLYDRISTRPFLEPIEKTWVVFQLLKGLAETHERGLCHGDIKSENVLMTSWKWTYIADWAPFKPVALPETDSADFLFYFNTAQRRTCYVAPERFTASGDGSADVPTQLTPEMDVYSTGCVIAELFLDGASIFTLADLFRYKRHDYTPPIDKIENADVRQLISSMISLDPADRKSAETYLQEYRGTLFPEYFWKIYDLLKPFSRFSDRNSDKMAEHMWENSSLIFDILKLDVEEVHGVPDQVLPVVVSLPGQAWVPRDLYKPDTCGAALILLSFCCALLRSTYMVSWRLKTCDMILALAEFVPDDVKVDRCLPYVIGLVKDDDENVQIAAIRTVTQILSTCSKLTGLNEHVFPEFIFHRFRLILGLSPRVKAVYAACLPKLTQLALSLVHGTDGSSPGEDDSLSLVQTRELHNAAVLSHVEHQTRALLTEKDSSVRRSLLQALPLLCVIMGRQKTNDIVLSHTITYLNDKTMEVRLDFFQFIAQVGPLIGSASLEQYVVPLMSQSLSDPSDDILRTVLASLSALTEVGLIRTKVLENVLPVCAKFFIHPDVYVRTQVSLLFASAAKNMSPAHIFCVLEPIVAPLMETSIVDFKDHCSYITAVKPHITVAVYNLAILWASKCQNSMFWNQTDDLSSSKSTQVPIVSFSPEDRRWLERLRDVGFNNEDLWQLILYRDYLHHVAGVPRRTNDESSSNLQLSGGPYTITEDRVPDYVKRYASYKGISETAVPEGNFDNPGDIRPTSLAFLGYPAEPTELGIAKPQGTLVTSIKVHRGAITSLAICADSKFFVTGADDCLIKVWDTSAAEKGVSRPSDVHEFTSAVKCVSFLRERTAFIVGLHDGTVHFVESSHPSKPETGLNYGNLNIIKSIALTGGYAQAIHQVGTDLYILNVNCDIVILDLNTLEKRFLKNPVDHGVPTCWSFGDDNLWVAIGTSHGIVDVWDLRFEILVQTWGIGQLKPISAVVRYPRTSSRHICVGGGFSKNIISVWDIQNGECMEILVPLSQESSALVGPTTPVKDLEEKVANWSLGDTLGGAHGVRALVSGPHRGSGAPIIISGGDDRILRYWDLESPQNCTLVSGLPYNHGKVTYVGRIGSNVKYTIENSTPPKRPEKQARSTVIVTEESDIGRNHRGSITQIGLLSLNSPMIISVDEVGFIKIYL